MSFRKIKLYGKLGKLFGKEWVLDVNTVGEALRAIDINTNGEFQKYLYNGPGAKIHYKVCVKNRKNTLTKEEINTPYEKGDIYIIPVLKGSGKNGLFQTILGVVLIVVSYFVPVLGVVGKIGFALALGGIAQMLSPNPNTNDVERKSSYLFQGNALTANQGTAVGTIYGRAIVNPMPICVSMDNVDENSYEGEIVNLGVVVPINESLILYSSKGGTATLIGYDEFNLGDEYATIPPPKYLKASWGGGIRINAYNWGDSNCVTPNGYYREYNFSGECNYDKITGVVSGGVIRTTRNYDGVITIQNLGCIFEIPWGSWTNNSHTERSWNLATCHYTESNPYGSYFSEADYGSSWILSEEDTELNAISRLMNSTSWSAWQSTPVYPFYYRDPAGFNIYYQTVKTKSITLPDKYNPGLQYKYSAVVQRRAYGSSDPWIDAETISTVVTPQSNGTLILPELEIPNESGYESKIVSPSLSY